MRREYRATADPFGARLSALASVTIFLMALVVVRLFVKSVVVHAEIVTKAEQQYLVYQPVAPERGKIFSSDASAEMTAANAPEKTWRPLATNTVTYALSVIPHEAKDKKEVAEKLTKWAGMSSDELFKKIDNDRLYIPPIIHGLSEDDKNQIVAFHLAGVYLAEEEQRLYPEGSLASQIIGFVNADNKGNYGLEQQYNEDLRGSGGQVLAERDVRGRLLSTEDQKPVRDGSDLILTIDRNVQGFVENTLKKALQTYQADSGTIVAMNVKTGAIVALASNPDFNPNEYNKVSKEDQSHFLNPAISQVWEPGSIFKTIVMAAAIDKGLVEPDTEGVFSNSVTIQGYQINTAEDKAFGRETMTQVLENSDNVAMVWVAEKLGNEQMYNALKNFGFGEITGIDLPGEVGGALRPLKEWRDVSRATMSFGQGISTTPMQIVSAMATLATGNLMQPHLVKQMVSSDGKITDIAPKVVHERVISPETATKIAGMMISVVERGHGKRAKVAGYKIAGKTGTAQIPDPQGGYSEDEHIGGFAGFFPADKPEFALVVKLDRPKTVKFAESSAAPTFGEIAQFMLNYYRIPPTEPTK